MTARAEPIRALTVKNVMVVVSAEYTDVKSPSTNANTANSATVS
jgi:hypothetical protein